MTDTPQEKPDPSIWGTDGNGAKQVGSSPDESGTLMDTIKHYWRAADTSIFSADEPTLAKEEAKQQDVINYEVAHDNPIRANIAAGYYALLDSATDMAKSLSSPKQLALQLATSGTAEAAGLLKTAKAIKASTMLANLYFAWRGGQQALTPQQSDETPIESAGRRVAGAGQAFLSAVGIKQSATELLQPIIQKRLGLSGDLATRVQDEVAKADVVQNAAKAQIDQLTAATKGQVDSTEQIAQGIQTDLERKMSQSTDAITGEAAKAVVMEQARVEATFEDALRRATGPVTTAPDLRAEIKNTLDAAGIQDKEIPRSIFNAIPSDATTARALTASELKAASMARQFVASGMGSSDVRASLVNLGYVPKQIDAIMNVAGVAQSADMSFQDVIRVKNDLWKAANSATGAARDALFEAHQNVDGLLQRAATEQGFGPTFKKANDTYSTFKRELGVGQMADFVEASNVSEQTTLDRMSKLLSPKQGETILKLLKVAGVDVSGLQSLSQEAETTADNATQTVKDITKQNTSQISQIQKDAAATVSKIGKENAIIPGGSNLDLAGKTTTEIRRQALLKLANNARKAGITNPSAFIQLTIGMLRMAAGSAMGTFQVASGGSKLGIQDLLQRKSFQDWMIQESGVTPSAAPAFRSAIASSADAITKLAQSTVLPRAIDASNQVRTLTPQPVTPIRPNRIAIAP